MSTLLLSPPSAFSPEPIDFASNSGVAARMGARFQQDPDAFSPGGIFERFGQLHGDKLRALYPGAGKPTTKPAGPLGTILSASRDVLARIRGAMTPPAPKAATTTAPARPADPAPVLSGLDPEETAWLAAAEKHLASLPTEAEKDAYVQMLADQLSRSDNSAHVRTSQPAAANTLTLSRFRTLSPVQQNAHIRSGGKLADDPAPVSATRKHKVGKFGRIEDEEADGKGGKSSAAGPIPIQSTLPKNSIVKSAYTRMTHGEQAAYLHNGGKVVFDYPATLSKATFDTMSDRERTAFCVARGRITGPGSATVWRTAIMLRSEWEKMPIEDAREYFRQGGRLAD